ncbi:methyl-accepting chemotaxis protein [Vibrio hangzhouensis]|uniref:Methyl-accepting chemotaxis sensory transducer with Cache sensor n=1 Tax=Vibrio hangzhouensis TaxID=462991 RepID=A0A1H5V5Z8_9VIBR|nr:methyl-accepting chemotaxis protein [Vibrio hangzhouensis]SEF82161.1 methyl-accepting chemotaxis sensory transducer with Cache sensor [Vibrio hangzhouensis]
MRLNNLSIRTKLQAIVAFAVLILFSLGTFNLLIQKEANYEQRKERVRSNVDIAYTLAKHYHGLENVLGREQAQQAAQQAISQLRYDGNNYFWIATTTNTIVMHPTQPQLNGTSTSTLTDSRGNHFWQEMASIAKQKGSGYLTYYWIGSDGEESQKVSFVNYIPEWDWIIGTGVQTSDIDKAFQQHLIKELIVDAIAALALVVICLVVARNIVQPIEKLVKQVHSVADGDLTINMKTSRQDEMGYLSNELDRMMTALKETITAAKASASHSSQLSSSIAAASEETSTSINSQSQQLEQLATAMSEMSSTIQDIAGNSERTSATTEESKEYAAEGSRSMGYTLNNIAGISDDINSTHQLMEALKQGVNDISNVVNVIHEVSEQTNLLALNAAIEAARAGEQGRGFAVVADEVRNLASRTQESTAQVQATIDKLNQRTDSVLTVMASNQTKVSESVELASQTQDKLDTAVTKLNDTYDMVAQIAAAAEQQGTVANEVNENVSIVHLSISEIRQASQSLAEQSQSMAQASDELSERLAYFKV